VAGTKSDVIAGDLGLPVLARFRLILDYSHNRAYALPYADAARAPFAKDRLGLSLDKEDAGFAVGFVAPDSPAQAAGFKVGDKITLIDGNSAEAWPGTSFADLRYGTSGSNLVFTMQSGGVRQVKLADYF
jgi:predicted metalloprotease with PDZ domain